jgi:hypothetical protein
MQPNVYTISDYNIVVHYMYHLIYGPYGGGHYTPTYCLSTDTTTMSTIMDPLCTTLSLIVYRH